MQFGSDYSYCGVDSATERLNEELRALGGGSAQSSRMALVAFYASPSSSASSSSNTHTSKDSILTALPSSLALRDPFASLSSVGGKAILRSEQFPCTPIPLQNALQSPDSLNITQYSSPLLFFLDLSNAVYGSEAVGSVLQGFNKCIFSFGEKGSGKTRLLFHDGRNESPEAAGDKESKSLVEALLRRLYQQLAIKVGIRDHRVAISCYFVRGNSVIDLLQKHEQKPYTPVQNMRLVDCPTLSIALATVKAARGGLDETSEQGRGHFFLRILVFQTRTEDPIDEGVPSSLFIVDLLGAAPTSGQAFNALTKEERIHRRVNALHLQTLSKVLLQMAKASEEALSSSSVRDSFCSSASILSAYETDASSAQVTSARDSTLTATLCPILQGNVAVSVLMFLVDAEEHFAVTKQTLRSLACVPHISCAAYTASAVRLSTLGIQSDHALLPLQSFNSNCAQKSKSRGKGRDWSVHFGELMEEYQGALASAIQSLPCPPTKDAEGARENQGQNYPVAPLRTVVDEKIREKSFQLSSEALLQELADLRVQMAEERAVHQDSEEELKASAAQCELKTYDLEVILLVFYASTLRCS